jgi:hypothetical protein
MKFKQKVLINYNEIQEANARRINLDENIKVPKPVYTIADFGFNIEDVYSYSISKKDKEIFIRMTNGDSHIIVYESILEQLLDGWFTKKDPLLYVNHIKMAGN